MMRIAICDRPNHVEVERRAVPSIGAESILVRVAVCGICGSDVAVWRGSEHRAYPYSPGHEFCGVVEERGANVTDLSVGDRVVIDPNLGCGKCRFCEMGRPNLCDVLKTRTIKSNGGLSEYVAVDCRMAYPLAESLVDELAVFIEPLSCAVHAVRCAKVCEGESVAIWGGGIMGVLSGLVAKSRGSEVVVVEPAEERRRWVGDVLGVSVIRPEEMAQSEVAGVLDVAIECSGNAAAVSQALTMLRKAGRAVLAGLVAVNDRCALPLIDVTTKELEIRGAWLNPNAFGEAIRLAEEYVDVLGALETRSFDLDDVASAFQCAAGGEVARVLVRP